MRSEVIHKSPPDHCVGKSVLHGKILRENYELCIPKICAVLPPLSAISFLFIMVIFCSGYRIVQPLSHIEDQIKCVFA